MKLVPIEVATAIIAIKMPLANSNLTNPLDQTKTLLANYQI